MTKGFTLIELLLSVAIMGVIFGIGVPVYQSLQSSDDLDRAAASVAHAWRRAQGLARANQGDQLWGVHVATGQLTLFQGANYAGRIVAQDEITDIPATITPSGFTDAVFSKMFGLPGVIGPTTTLTLTSSNGTRTLTLTPKGTVLY